MELDKSAKRCALCSTPVYNPNDAPEKKPEPPFAEQVQIPKTTQRRFVAYVITMVLLIPNMVLVLVNIFFLNKSAWSVYVFSSCFLVWTLFVYPFYHQKIHPYLLWGIDTLAVSAYVYVFFILKTQTPWLFKTLFSVIGVLSLSTLVFIIWIRKKERHWTAITAHVLLDLTVVSILAGAVAAFCSDITGFLAAGIICSACFCALMGFFLYCNRSKHMRAWLNKVFYI